MEIVKPCLIQSKGKEKKPGQEHPDLDKLFDKMQITVVGKETRGADDSDNFEDDGSDESIDDEDVEDLEQAGAEEPISKKHLKYGDLEERAREDMQFPDEVDTPFVNGAERFQKYRGIKSLRNCDWDPYENLPIEYAKVWRFDSYMLAQKGAL